MPGEGRCFLWRHSPEQAGDGGLRPREAAGSGGDGGPVGAAVAVQEALVRERRAHHDQLRALAHVRDRPL